MDDEIKQQLQTLPQELRAYIASDKTHQKIEALLEGQPMDEAQKEAFGLEVMLVLLRLQSIAGFAMNIKHNMQIAQSRADELARTVKQVIFTPIQDMLVTDETTAQENTQTTGDIVPPQKVEEREQDVYREPVESTIPTIETEREYKEKQQTDALDVFKKRLAAPIHTPAQEENLEDTEERIANTNPSTKEELKKDPYKETIE